MPHRDSWQYPGEVHAGPGRRRLDRAAIHSVKLKQSAIRNIAAIEELRQAIAARQNSLERLENVRVFSGLMAAAWSTV